MMSAKKFRVLVIDDNEDILLMLEAMLKLKDYNVSTKNNIDNLETSLKEILPDVILMDMLLSGGDGREVCKYLKASINFSHIPLIMISAHPQAREQCLEAGADYFLDKPFDMNDLFKSVAAALNNT